MKVTADADPLLSTQELADYLGVPLRTIYEMNYRREAPRRIRVGRAVRYRMSDVVAWLDARVVDGAAS